MREAVPLGEAIAASAALARLEARLRESRARLAVVVPRLAGGLGQRVSAGGFDDDGWSLVADNAAVAAKLRHCVPDLIAALGEAGLPTPVLRIKVKKG